MARPLPRPPIRIDSVFDDPSIVRDLIERHAPYLPVQRYFTNQAEFEASSGQGRMFIAPNFRGDWAYDEPLVEGVEPLLQHEAFREAAAKLFDAKVVRPQQVYCNLTVQLPFNQGGGHTDVPAFRGVDRTGYPISLLQVMGHSQLFERYRVFIATAVAWFYQGEDGGFEYWPDGPRAPSRVHEGDIYNTAIMGDNDFMYHRVRPTGAREGGLLQGMTLDTRLEREAGDRWRIVEGENVLSTFSYAQIRSSVSWKAMVFRDEQAALVFDEKRDLLSIDMVWATFEEDLARRGIEARCPADPVADEDWMRTLSAAYIEEPEAGNPQRD
jgi:hypothetical protein